MRLRRTQQYHTINYEDTKHGISVTENLCQGSEGEGFVFPFTTCDKLSAYPFIRNTAGSCEVACMYEKLEQKTCLAAAGAIGYAS